MTIRVFQSSILAWRNVVSESLEGLSKNIQVKPLPTLLTQKLAIKVCVKGVILKVGKDEAIHYSLTWLLVAFSFNSKDKISTRMYREL